MRREGSEEKRHRARREPCECRRGFVPFRPLPKPWYAAVDWLQVVCSVGLGLIGWVILGGAVAHAALIDGSMLISGLCLWALSWAAAGLCGWWSVAPLFEGANVEQDESEEEEWVK